MDKLRQTLVNGMELKNIKRSEVAKKVGVSSSRITEYLNDGKDIPFDILMNMIDLLCPDKEIEMMSEYANEVNKPSSLLLTFEYCSTHRLFDELGQLVTSTKDHNSKKVRGFSEVYGLVHQWQTDSFDDKNELFIKVRDYKTNDDHLKVLLVLIEMNILYSSKEYRMVKTLSKDAENKINDLKDGFIKNSYNARVFEMIGYVELKVNCNFEGVRKSAESILNSSVGSAFKGYAYYLIGMSYMYTDFEQSKLNFNKSLVQYKKARSFQSTNAVKGNIDLLHFIWNKENNNELYSSVLNECKQALNILKKKSEYFQNSTLGKYIKGVILEDKKFLLESLSMSIKQGDNLLSHLPKKKLQDMGENVDMFDGFKISA